MGKKSRCSVIRCSPCHIARSKKVISGDNWYYGQGPKFTFFKGEVQVSLSPEGLGCLPLKRTCIPRRRILRRLPRVSPAMSQRLDCMALTL